MLTAVPGRVASAAAASDEAFPTSPVATPVSVSDGGFALPIQDSTQRASSTTSTQVNELPNAETIAAALPAESGSVGQETTYSATETLPVPPASTYGGSGGGD